ncbi:MAG: hypothetical protein IKM05_02975 [Clostridia bacterium]|nr:hypothetical protein [Clostridia bacterium]
MRILSFIMACIMLIGCTHCFAQEENTMNYTDPKALPTLQGMPDLFTFQDGSKVETIEDWQRRRVEIKGLYEYYLYGYLPDKAGETLSYTLTPLKDGTGYDMLITVAAGGKEASFSVTVTLPRTEAPEKGYPYFIEYIWAWPGMPKVTQNQQMAAARGYAGIAYDPSQCAADNSTFTGAYYTLYPYYTKNPQDKTGVLLAWAWGVSKIIDALEMGAGKEMNIDPAMSLVGGVSRYGKSVAVAGVYDERIKVVIPSCSGAGGMAPFRTSNQGKTYNLSSLGGPEAWVNESLNEPLANLKGGEGYWFCWNFRYLSNASVIPVEQYMLSALVADPDRHMIIVTGITSEGWNNTEGQCFSYIAAQPVWDMLGCHDQNNMIIHLDGHAILPSDMQYILDYCDVHLYDKDPSEVKSDLSQMKGNLFLEHNRNVLGEEFAPYLEEIQN